jgi:hypothetical protein
MKKFSILLALILVPTFALGESMVYFKSTPKAVYRKLQGVVCSVDTDGTDMDQPIMITDPPGDASDKAYWVALVPDNQVVTLRAKPSFLGKGLTEVKTAKPAAYKKMVNWTWQLKTDNTVNYTVLMSDNTYQAGTLYKKIAEDIPIQTFSGYDPMTGNPK